MKLSANLFHNTKSRSATSRSSYEYINPLRDWALILVVITILFFGGVAYTMYDFYTQFVVSPEEAVSDERITEYRDVDVQARADEYQKKEEAFNALRGVAPIPKPAEETVVEEGLAPEEQPEYTGDAEIELSQ